VAQGGDVQKKLEGLQADLAAIEKIQPRRPSQRKPKSSKPASVQPQGNQGPAALAVVENRHPITLAFERCLQQDLASQDIQDQWKEDLTNAVIQGAKKFVGFNNVIALRKALDINLGLISIALLLRTDGKADVDAWAGIVQKVEVTELIGETLSQIKALSYNQEFLFVELYEQPPREALLAIATARDAKRKNAWVGYDRLVQEQRSRKNLHTTDRLARFLIECLLRKNPKIWVEWKSEGGGNINAEPNVPLAEEIINTLIFRYCTLKTGERIPEDIDLQSSYISRLRAEYEADPQAWLAGAKSRFEQLLKLVSPEMKDYLLEKDWFDTRLAGGPPKPVKVASSKKSKPKDDDAAEYVDIAGISGIYCYSIYG
jgi:hypothetical protein